MSAKYRHESGCEQDRPAPAVRHTDFSQGRMQGPYSPLQTLETFSRRSSPDIHVFKALPQLSFVELRRLVVA
jgi:hypothetical protein